MLEKIIRQIIQEELAKYHGAKKCSCPPKIEKPIPPAPEQTPPEENMSLDSLRKILMEWAKKPGNTPEDIRLHIQKIDPTVLNLGELDPAHYKTLLTSLEVE